MNVLYVTGHHWDDDFIIEELARPAPHVQVDISSQYEDAAAMATIPGRYDALLVDVTLVDGDAAALILRLRDLGLPLTIVVLLDSLDEEIPAALMSAGADEIIVKRPQFYKNLPFILQGAVSRRRTEEALQNAKAEYAQLEEELTVRQQQWDAQLSKYEQERIALLEAVRAADAKFTQAEDQRRLGEAELHSVKLQMEWQRSALEEALRTAEIEQRRLVLAQKNECPACEHTRQELERQVQEIEKKQAQFDEVVCQMKADHEKSEARHHGERETWNGTLIELQQQLEDLKGIFGAIEKERVLLKDAVQSLDARNAAIIEESRIEKEKCGKALHELEGQNRQQHAKIEALEAALTAAREEMMRELAECEQRTAVLQNTLARAEENLFRIQEERRLERTDRQLWKEELECQRAARIALEGALRAAEARQQVPFVAVGAVQALAELAPPVADCGRMFMEHLDPADPRRQNASRLVEIATRAGKIAQGLLRAGAPAGLDLNSAITQLMGKLVPPAGKDIELVPILAPKLPKVFASWPMIEQLLTGLVQQACESLPLGGTVTIESAVPVPAVADGALPRVLLAVTASGYSLHSSAGTATLAPLAALLGGSMSITGDTDTGVTLEVRLPSDPPAAD
jgi:DNA-binding NarL/FixJ family response regulator